MLKEYEDDGQRLPGDGGYGSEEDEGEEEFDIIHTAEWLAREEDDPASDPRMIPRTTMRAATPAMWVTRAIPMMPISSQN